MTRERTRPDESGKPGYITAEGYRRLEEEAERLWSEDRPRMAKAVQVAAAEGDRSENAEYIYSKKKLAEIDRRLRFLGKRLDVLEIVGRAPSEDGKVYFASWVVLEAEDETERTYRIVGADETHVDPRYISMDSPFAKALIGREEGDEVLIRRPRGDDYFTIVEVANQPPAAEESS